jgi:hypothetical protein
MVLFTIDQYLNNISYLSWILWKHKSKFTRSYSDESFDHLYNKHNKIDNFNI